MQDHPASPSPASPADLLGAYTRQVLAYRLGPDAVHSALPDPISEDSARSAAARLARSLERSGRRWLVLLGLGSGLVAAHAAALLSDPSRLVVCERDPETARRALAQGALPAGGGSLLLADTSAAAMRLMLDHAGLRPEQWLTALNPELPPAAKAAYAELRALLSAPLQELPADTDGAPPLGSADLTIGAILRPDEPDLAAFLACLPPAIPQVLVWDGGDVPAHGLPAHPRRVELARPLAGDFAAQRNALLEACRAHAPAPWLLTLDADERLTPAAWAMLPALLAQTGVAGYHLPRRTLYPNFAHAKAGYGLWPDLQLRLFRLQPGAAYRRPVHERLEGLAGPTAIVLNAALDHLSRLSKSSQELARKLRGFDAAAQAAGLGWGSHRLNVDYPHLPLSMLPGDASEDARAAAPRLLLLPPAQGM